MDEPVEDDKHGYESEFESTTGSVEADSLHSSETGHSPRGIVGWTLEQIIVNLFIYIQNIYTYFNYFYF